MTTATQNPLSFLHGQLAEMDDKGLHFRLRVLEGEQRPVAHFDGKGCHQSQLEQLSRPDDA